MTYSSDFVQTVALIAATAQARVRITPEQAVDFAWFSVNQDGDASIDTGDFNRHLELWRERGDD